MIATVELARFFDGNYVTGFLNDAKDRNVPAGVRTYVALRAGLAFGDVEAPLAPGDPGFGAIYGGGQAGGVLSGDFNM